uniref:Zinc finger, CCHC-type n=1 Tax=Tanacetum cinerariifolium TaxID=118510 RepID=A0A699JJ98_TANCI|nr:hypothetical protein [Tanacetum cinerariifolium]
MAQPDNNTQLSSAFKTFFERETLTGVNFNDWYRSLRTVLRVADTYDYLYKPCPDQPFETASEEDKGVWKAEYKKHNDAIEIYVLEMKGYMDQLHALGKSYENDMAFNLINRLAHIGKTCMQKLQREGILESINDESFDKYESCISRKMTKKPFNDNIERATDLLGLIHTDVCGPLRHVSRKEVELQLGKKIKALCSDRGGEYISQEFIDYLRYPKETMGYYFYFPPENKVIVARSKRTTRAPNHLCLNIEVKDDEVGAIDEEMNSMKVMKV